MTIDEVRQLTVGDYVASPHDLPAYLPRRVTVAPWINADGTLARLSLHSYCNGAWVAVDGWVRAPGPDWQYRWNAAARQFVRRGQQGASV